MKRKWRAAKCGLIGGIVGLSWALIALRVDDYWRGAFISFSCSVGAWLGVLFLFKMIREDRRLLRENEELLKQHVAVLDAMRDLHGTMTAEIEEHGVLHFQEGMRQSRN
jgi:hypothetical protein